MTQIETLPDRLLKGSEVAKILNISRTYAYQLMRDGIIPTVTVLGVKRVTPKDLDRFIREHTSK